MDESGTYALDDYVADLRRIAAEISDESEIIDRVAPRARRLALAKETWLRPEHYETDEEQGFGAHLLHEEPDHTLAVFALAWAPRRGTPPHDHGTWAVVAGVDGVERNVKYNRLDDRSRPDYCELEEKGTLMAGPGDVVCLKPRGIHLVWNDSDRVTLSLHTYGKHVNHTGRSTFDPETNTVEPFVVTVTSPGQ